MYIRMQVVCMHAYSHTTWFLLSAKLNGPRGKGNLEFLILIGETDHVVFPSRKQDIEWDRATASDIGVSTYRVLILSGNHGVQGGSIKWTFRRRGHWVKGGSPKLDFWQRGDSDMLQGETMSTILLSTEGGALYSQREVLNIASFRRYICHCHFTEFLTNCVISCIITSFITNIPKTQFLQFYCTSVCTCYNPLLRQISSLIYLKYISIRWCRVENKNVIIWWSFHYILLSYMKKPECKSMHYF